MLSPALGLVDSIYASLSSAFSHKRSKFFAGGYGDMDRLSSFEDTLVEHGSDAFPCPEIQLDEPVAQGDIRTTSGTFESPIKDLLPEESHTGHILIVESNNDSIREDVQGVVVHLTATGDTGFDMRRRLVADNLARRGFVSVLLMPPFYGKRAPQQQHKYYVDNVADYMLHCSGMMLEACKLAQWARRHYPDALVGLTGISQGGAMCTGAALLDRTEHPLAVTACIGSASPKALLTGGLRKQVALQGPKIEEILTKTTVRNLRAPQTDDASSATSQKQYATVAVYATSDKIVLPSEAHDLTELLQDMAPSAHRAYGVPGGHVSAIAFGSVHFPDRIVESFELLRQATQEVGEPSTKE